MAGQVLFAHSDIRVIAGRVPVEAHQRALRAPGRIELLARMTVVEEQQQPLIDRAGDRADQRRDAGADLDDLPWSRRQARQRLQQR